MQYPLKLLNRHFPVGSPLHKIFNKNTVKLSYSCMENIKTMISSHNKTCLSKQPDNQTTKNIVRICTNSHYLAHSPPLFADLNTLTVQDINKLQTALFMYKYHNNLLPDIFTDYFVKANTIHGYNTRQSYMYRPCYFNTHLANNSIKRQSPLIWSSVPQNIRDSTSVFSFKTKFKAELISRY